MDEIITYDNIIDHCVDKGIKFDIASKEQALQYIRENNYFFRVYSYRKNYPKNEEGQYINLDFAYLIELSKIDRDLRYILFDLCIDVEHYIKKEIVKRVTSAGDQNEIVSQYFMLNEGAKERIEKQDKLTSYSHNLIEKYSDNYPIWVFVEVVSFGTLTSFCSFYEEKYSESIISNKILNNIRDLRNAVAHNCCLLVDFVGANQVNPDSRISSFVSKCGIGGISRKKSLSNKFIYDLICLFYVHKNLINDPSKFGRLKDFLNVRAINKKEYFVNNQPITRVYNFIKKVVESILTLEQ